MRPYRSLSEASNVAELVARLHQLRPDSARQWGTMTSHEMLCHLADAFLAMHGERPVAHTHTWLSRTIVRRVAFHTRLPWPRGVKSGPEVDPKRQGTRPVDFERDRTRVVELLRRFVETGVPGGVHPIFGPLTPSEWMLWGYGHVDHHLRQFGV